MAEILVARATFPTALALLDARDDVNYEVLESPTLDDLEARIAGIDAILVGLTPIQAPLIAKAARLKVVSRFGVGYDNVDVAALTAQGNPLHHGRRRQRGHRGRACADVDVGRHAGIGGSRRGCARR